MMLPNAERAEVARAKVVDYLLSSVHPRGQSKARFFIRFGFSRADWEQFANALAEHGASYAVTSIVESEYGTTYTVDGAIKSPDGRNPRVRTVWMIRHGSDAPYLTSARPQRS